MTTVFVQWDVKQQRQEAVIRGEPVALPLVYLAHAFPTPGASTPSSHIWLEGEDSGSPLFSPGDLKYNKKGLQIKLVELWPTHSSLLKIKESRRENLSVNEF